MKQLCPSLHSFYISGHLWSLHLISVDNDFWISFYSLLTFNMQFRRQTFPSKPGEKVNNISTVLHCTERVVLNGGKIHCDTDHLSSITLTSCIQTFSDCSARSLTPTRHKGPICTEEEVWATRRLEIAEERQNQERKPQKGGHDYILHVPRTFCRALITSMLLSLYISGLSIGVKMV